MTGYDWTAIKGSADIVEVIGRAVDLRKRGNVHEGLCPFHGERTPSFKVYEDHWHCYGCGKHGDAIDFVMEYESCTHAEAIERIVGKDFTMDENRKAQIERDRQERSAREAEQRAKVKAESIRRWDAASPAEEHPYLKAKKIKPHMARMEGKSLLLPVYDGNGDIQCVQAISPRPDERGKWPKLFPKGGTMEGGRCNFGINVGRTIVCEGFSTGASIYEAFPQRVTVAFSKAGVKAVVTELVKAGISVEIAADRTGLPEITAFARDLGVSIFVPRDPYDDFNDMAQECTRDEIAAIFRGPPLIAEPEPEQPESDTLEDEDEPADLWGREPPPALPHGLLPPVIENFARVQAKLAGYDPSGLAMCALAACGAAIRDSVEIKVKRHERWTESARLWTMMIGEPSSKKSPIMRAATARIKSIDADMLRNYNRAMRDWKDGGEHGEMPVQTRLRIEDITMESAQEVCAVSPDGVLAIQDELSGWFGGIEKYAGGKGCAKDRSFWLQAYGGGTYAVNRISRKSVLIDNLSVSIVGGIQPDAIRKVMAGATDDGLIQRFLPCVLRPADLGTEEELPDMAGEFDGLIDRLHATKPPSSFLGPQPLTFDDGAQKLRADLERKHHGMIIGMERLNKKLATHIGKYDGIFPRLCIIWHCIENANLDDLPEVVSEDTAKRVADFLHGFVFRHAMAFYRDVVGLGEDEEKLADIAGYILAHNVEKVTYRTFQRGSTIMRKFTKEECEPVCQQLQAYGWLENYEFKNGKISATVNPKVHQRYAEQAEIEKERRAVVREMISSHARARDTSDK